MNIIVAHDPWRKTCGVIFHKPHQSYITFVNNNVVIPTSKTEKYFIKRELLVTLSKYCFLTES